jgi:small multidrug resistance family-3 protein
LPNHLEVFAVNLLNRLVANPLGAFATLTLAAYLEAHGDSFFQVGFYRSTGWSRVLWVVAGTVVLALYGTVVNVPRWDFGKLLGVYVVMFFLMAQLQARVRFGQSPTPPIYVGGGLIVAGGLVIAFWRA